MDPMPDGRRRFEGDGFVVLRGVVDAPALTAEFDQVMADAFVDPEHVNTGSAGNSFRYVPTMSEHTPVSVATAVRLAVHAAALLGGPVLPGRAKATSYLTGTGWHRDAQGPVRSIGIACYLDPLHAANGALQVVPGSHRDPRRTDADALVVASRPGDAIVFDEHLLHASTGGGRRRRQWRVDFVADDGGPGSSDDELRAYFAGLHAPGWDGGYDVDRYPSYATAWRKADPRWERRLDELGAFAAAAAEECSVRRGRVRAVSPGLPATNR